MDPVGLSEQLQQRIKDLPLRCWKVTRFKPWADAEVEEIIVMANTIHWEADGEVVYFYMVDSTSGMVCCSRWFHGFVFEVAEIAIPKTTGRPS